MPETIPPIDLKRQHASMQAEIDAAIGRVMASGWFISGPETKAFEQEYAAYCGVEHAVALGSGSASLNLALKALGIGAGDEVITVAFTLSATLDAIVELGATPVLVDVTEDTYTMDPAQVAAAVTPRTKAILPVNIYGHPADIDAIEAAAPGLPIIVDACESHGATYKGKPATMAGTASCFSFYPTKNLNAIGDAGGVTTSDAALADRIRMLRQHGWDRRFHSAISSLNSRMDEIHAAVLRAKLPRLDGWNARRTSIAREYDLALKGTSIIPATKAEWAEPSYYLYVARTPERDRLR
ncbi:MAG: DegT/DnrJ/EryC1/StrS family aminotransferase, partial [Dehalococcoidia bacterium]